GGVQAGVVDKIIVHPVRAVAPLEGGVLDAAGFDKVLHRLPIARRRVVDGGDLALLHRAGGLGRKAAQGVLEGGLVGAVVLKGDKVLFGSVGQVPFQDGGVVDVRRAAGAAGTAGAARADAAGGAGGARPGTQSAAGRCRSAQGRRSYRFTNGKRSPLHRRWLSLHLMQGGCVCYPVTASGPGWAAGSTGGSRPPALPAAGRGCRPPGCPPLPGPGCGRSP